MALSNIPETNGVAKKLTLKMKGIILEATRNFPIHPPRNGTLPIVCKTTAKISAPKISPKIAPKKRLIDFKKGIMETMPKALLIREKSKTTKRLIIAKKRRKTAILPKA